MKPINFPIILLSIVIGITSLQAKIKTQIVFSEDGQYRVQIKGRFYEGFAGNQEISLINLKGDTLWKQVVPRRFLILPSVSNKGDVAIVNRDIKIYDKSNVLKGILPLKDQESPYHSGDYMGSVHGFSANGNYYFIYLFTNSPDNIVDLFCLTDSAKVVWNLNFDRYKPSEILFYGDIIIVHDFSLGKTEYTNCCYVLDLDGKILWEYKTDIKNPSLTKVIINRDNGILLVKDQLIEEEIQLDTLNSNK